MDSSERERVRRIHRRDAIEARDEFKAFDEIAKIRRDLAYDVVQVVCGGALVYAALVLTA